MYHAGLRFWGTLSAVPGKRRGSDWRRKDTAASHKKFADKYGLPFILLADPEKRVLELYDVWKEKMMYGKKVMGVVRTTYLIDEAGMIAGVFGKVKAAENADQMLKELK